MRAIFMFLVLMGSVYAQDIYKIKDKLIEGKEFDMASLKGKVALIVNIASQCGYTPQLAELEAVHQKYQAQGLVVLGVPTNDFGGQTPESDVGMKDFCTKNYNATFPILKKSTVQGKDKRELYKFLTEKTPKNFQGEIGWNFEKFLVSKSGQVVGRFKSAIKPVDQEITSLIEKELK